MLASESSPAVILKGVSKSFGDVQAVRSLDLEIEAGCVYGLLGPNGSGKSTTMRMMLGLVKHDSGDIRIMGLDPRADSLAVKRIVGHVPESPRLYEYLTGLEYLDFVGDVYGLETEVKRARIHEFLDAFGLEDREDEMISGYSHGMKQKVAIIGAILHRPRLLILDEPLSGLDPKSARITKDMIHRMAEEGVTTVFSTHVLEIADAMCDKICVLYEGRKIAEGNPTELRRMAGMRDSTLEEVFLKITEVEDVQGIVDALVT
jgi:ABC-2 type transport system ATP-binding protein